MAWSSAEEKEEPARPCQDTPQLWELRLPMAVSRGICSILLPASDSPRIPRETARWPFADAMAFSSSTPTATRAIQNKAVWPYVQQWHLDVQRELPSNIVGTASYVGSKGTHLTMLSDLNQLLPV